jgi:hypothetical protein
MTHAEAKERYRVSLDEARSNAGARAKRQATSTANPSNVQPSGNLGTGTAGWPDVQPS